MTAPPDAIPGQRVVGEPRRLRHELAWPIELPDGRRAVLAQLVPELAADVALRRRWVIDMERVAALPVARLAPTLAIGPAPDPRAPDAAPPWRVRLDPPGQTLDARLRRAPLPDDEVIALGGELADAVQSLHAAGAVLRDLDPRAIVLGDDGRAWFTDIGHARLAILSSRTASSLLLESSPYVAPEALLGTVIDARADVYSLGVVLWRALTGDVPFPASLIASRTAVPDLAALRPAAPGPLIALVTRCLAHDPEHRPLGELRATPAMLPAADAQVAAVAAALAATRSPDVRARLEELATLVQRLCDAHEALAGDAVDRAPDRAPIAALVELARRTAEAIDAIDLQLATLDEAAIVRALARSEARREAPALRVDLLAGLDTLRQLEDQRAVLIGRLLEITSLARTAIELHLAHAAAVQTEDIEVARAFEALRLST